MAYQALMKKQQRSYEELLRIKLEKEVVETNDTMMETDKNELLEKRTKSKLLVST